MRQRASGSIVAQTPWHLRGFAGGLLNGYSLGTSGEWRTGLSYTMRTTGAIPAPSCSYQEYLQSGPACVAINDPAFSADPDPARGSAVSAPASTATEETILFQVGRNTFRYPAVTNLDVRASKRTHINDRMTFELLGEALTSSTIKTYFRLIQLDTSSTTTPPTPTPPISRISAVAPPPAHRPSETLPTTTAPRSTASARSAAD